MDSNQQPNDDAETERELTWSRPGSEPHTPEPPPGSLSPGDKIGQFTVIRFIASGGMGQVWEASDDVLRRVVALKVVRPELVDSRSLELFTREAHAGGRLVHPNIVQTFGHGTSGGLSWIAQEMVAGSWSVKDLLDDVRSRDAVPRSYYRDVAKLVALVADGLAAAHIAGVVHRDVKPQNLLIDPSGAPKVADFGLARVSDDSVLSRTGEFAGTYAYMSPEQLTAKRMGLDHRTDVFSLGIVLYELLTLQRPFSGDTTHQVAEKIITSDPPSPTRVRSQCPGDLGAICEMAIEKAPSRRYQSMEAFSSDIRRYLANEPILARSPTPVRRAVKWARRHPTVSSVLAIAGIALVSGALLLASLLRSERALQQRNEDFRDQNAQLEAANAELVATNVRLAEETYAVSLHIAVAARDAGNFAEAYRRLMACPEANRGWEWDHLRLSLDPSRATLVGHGGPVIAVAFSPDDKVLYSASSDGTMRSWDVPSGEHKHTFEAHGGPITAMDLSTDGSILVSGSEGGTLEHWDPITGRLVRTLGELGSEVVDVSVREDGTQLLSFCEDGSAALWELRSGAALRRWVHEEPDPYLARTSQPWISFASGGSKIITSTISRARVWEAATGDLTFESPKKLRGERSFGTVASLNPKRGALLLGRWTWGATAFLFDSWDVATARQGIQLVAPSRSCLGAAFGPSGHSFASNHGDRVIIWDLATQVAQHVVHTFPDPERNTKDEYPIAYEPSGDWLLSAIGAIVYLIDVRSGEVGGTFAGHRGPVRDLVWCHGGRFAASASDDGTIRLLDRFSRTGLSEGTSPYFAASAVSAKGDWIVLACVDGLPIVHNSVSGDIVAMHPRIGTGIESVAIGPEDAVIGLGLYDGSFQLSESMSGEEISRRQHGSDRVSSITFSSDGRRVIVGGQDEAVSAWEGKSGAEVERFATKYESARSLAISSDGSRLVLGSHSTRHALQVWDLGTTTLDQILHTGSMVGDMEVSPDGELIVAGCSDGVVRVWSMATLELLHEMRGHGDGVTQVAIHPGGQRAVTAGTDGSLIVWNLLRGRKLMDLPSRGTKPIKALHFLLAGRRLVAMDEADDSMQARWQVFDTDSQPAATFSVQEQDRQELRGYVSSLHHELLIRDDVIESIEADSKIDEAFRAQAIRVAKTFWDGDVNGQAWQLIDPDRENLDTDIVRGLRLARRAVELEPENWAARDTLAWALVANGDISSAVKESKVALELAPTERKAECEGYLSRIEKLELESKGKRQHAADK